MAVKVRSRQQFFQVIYDTPFNVTFHHFAGCVKCNVEVVFIIIFDILLVFEVFFIFEVIIVMRSSSFLRSSLFLMLFSFFKSSSFFRPSSSFRLFSFFRMFLFFRLFSFLGRLNYRRCLHFEVIFLTCPLIRATFFFTTSKSNLKQQK